MVCEPAPAVTGLNEPATVVPAPFQAPPAGVAEKLNGAAEIHIGNTVLITGGDGTV